jgi:hypothetical protein
MGDDHPYVARLGKDPGLPELVCDRNPLQVLEEIAQCYLKSSRQLSPKDVSAGASMVLAAVGLEEVWVEWRQR